MSVFRVEKNKNYTVMSNYHLRDENLSLKARGLLSMILSLPEDWDYSLAGLVKISKDGLSAVRAALHELEDNGYIYRERQRGPDGRLGGSIYTVYEYPHPVSVTPTYDNHTQEIHTYENDTELSKDITNICKKPNTEETNNTFLQSSRVREEIVDNLIGFIVEQIGRPLSNIERRTCVRWVEEGIKQDLIKTAVNDNLFRNDYFHLKYVDETLKTWKERGITEVKDAKNYILDNHVRNISNMAGEIARQRYNDDLAESIMQKNPAADLQGTRDYMIELYQTRRYEALLSMADITYHKDILDYLPDEIVEFIRKHKA